MSQKISKNLSFVGVGAEKAGTTWIADILREHPEICIPEKKEIFFFNSYDPHFLKIKNEKYKRGITWYLNQFSECQKNIICGEITPTYFYEKIAAKRIKRHFPKTKIIISLRNPVDRAYSQYIHDLRLGVIRNISFEEVLEKYDSYIKKSLYSKMLDYYFSLFQKENVFVLISEEMSNDARGTSKSLYKFLGVKDINFLPKSLYKKVNSAGEPKFVFINFFMMQTEYFLRRKKMYKILEFIDTFGIRELAIRLREKNSTKHVQYPNINKLTKQKLHKLFEKDIEVLEKVLDRELTIWKR